jgi:uroporphyrinogen-III synthase
VIGRRIVNTRAAHQAEALNALLRERGAIPVAYPCIALLPPDDLAPLDSALRDLAAGGFDWLMLTSVNTIDALAERLDGLGLRLDGVRIAAVGAATAAAARAVLHVAQIDLVGDADGTALAAFVPPGARVLLPQSARARPTLAAALTGRGADVRVVEAYQTMCGTGGLDVPRLLAAGQIDAITFASSSAVACFLERIEREGGRRESALSLPVGCIGAPTAETARAHGFTAIAQPAVPTLAGLVEVLARRLTD